MTEPVETALLMFTVMLLFAVHSIRKNTVKVKLNAAKEVRFRQTVGLHHSLQWPEIFSNG